MIKSSFHLQIAVIAFALLHNLRLAYASYLIGSSENNEYDKGIEEAFEYYTSLKREAEMNYYIRTKQRIQTAKERYIWEAVVNLKPSHSLVDVQRLTKELEKKYGWRSIHISIHLDEGYVNSMGDKVYNTHAHILLFMLDIDGIYLMKKREFGKKKMSELQAFVAAILGMERGTSKLVSKRERLNHKQYRQVAQDKESMKNEIIQFKSQIKLLEEQVLQEGNEKMEYTYKHEQLEDQFIQLSLEYEEMKKEGEVSVKIKIPSV